MNEREIRKEVSAAIDRVSVELMQNCPAGDIAPDQHMAIEKAIDVVTEQLAAVHAQNQEWPDGWTHYHTGGGCTALFYDVPDAECHWLITCFDDPQAPKSPHEMVMLGLYRDDREDPQEMTQVFNTAIEAFEFHEAVMEAWREDGKLESLQPIIDQNIRRVNGLVAYMRECEPAWTHEESGDTIEKHLERRLDTSYSFLIGWEASDRAFDWIRGMKGHTVELIFADYAQDYVIEGLDFNDEGFPLLRVRTYSEGDNNGFTTTVIPMENIKAIYLY